MCGYFVIFRIDRVHPALITVKRRQPMNFNEYVPNGQSSWAAHLRSEGMKDSIKSWGGVVLMTLLLLGAYALCGYIDSTVIL